MSNANDAEQQRAQQRNQSLRERIAARTLAKQEEKFLAERAAAAQADRDQIIGYGREVEASRRLSIERMRSITQPRVPGAPLFMQTEASPLSERESQLSDAYYLDLENERRGYERSGVLPSQEVSRESIGRHEEYRFGSVAEAAKFGMRASAPYAELNLDENGAVLGKMVYPGQANAEAEPDIVHAEVIEPAQGEAFGEVIEDDRQALPIDDGYGDAPVHAEVIEDELPSMQGEAIDEAQRGIDIELGRTAEPVPESEQQLSNKKRFPELFAGQAGYDGSGGRGGPEGPPALTKRFPELYSGNSEGPRPIELGQQLGG